MIAAIWRGVAAWSNRGPAPSYVTIASASAAGAYHDRAVAICLKINQDRETDGLRCLAARSSGSEANAALLRNKMRRVDVALMQNNIFAERRNSDAQGNPTEEALVTLPARSDEPPLVMEREALFVLVREEDGIKTLSDLKGKRLALDQKGSGTRSIAIPILNAAGVPVNEEPPAPDFDPAAYGRLLCDDVVDAGFWVVSAARRLEKIGKVPTGDPENPQKCDLSLVAIDGETFRRAFDDEARSFYCGATVCLKGCAKTVESFGPIAYLVTSEVTLSARADAVDAVLHAAQKVSPESRAEPHCPPPYPQIDSGKTGE